MSTSPEPRDVALEAGAKAMSRLETVLSRSTPEATHEQIPRSMLLEIDHWDPDELEVVPIGTFLEIFDGITRDLTETQKVQLLRIKLRGTAKTFLLDNGHLLEGPTPYYGLRRALIRWYSREDPEKAAERLWTMQKSTGETFRQYAERVRHTAAQAAKVDGLLMDDIQRRTWIAARSVKAFLKGLPGQYAGFFVNNPPASLEEALKKAEQLEDALEPREADHWKVARIQTQDKRCFRCRELGHIASGCPNIPRPSTPPPQRRNAMGSPQKPCLYCGGRTHFPAHCLKNPKNFPCEYCGLYGHKESDCRVKLSHYADESMCDYCGYYGHLEAECPQKTETCIKMEANHRPEPRKVLALTSEAYEPNPQQAVSLRAEKKTADAPSTPTSRTEEPDICVPAPMRPRVAVVGSSDAFDPSHLLEPADVDVLASDDCPILDPSEEFPTEDLDEPIPDLLETAMSGGKDLQAMFRDVERRVTEGVNQDDSCHSEPTEEPALPQPSVSVIEPSGVIPVQIAELVAQLQSPTYSPIHDAAAIAEAILEKLRSCVNMSLCVPAQVTELPPEPASQPMEETFEDQLPDEESDHPAQERQCIACNRNRAHNSRLWCEACRMFLRRSRKATAEGHPFTCNNAHHQQRPDTTNCRGCRAKKLDALEAEILHPEDSDDADEGIGFRRGGECNPRVPPLRITVNRSPLKRARARSAASTPAAPPVPGPSFAQSAPVAPPVPRSSFAQSTPAAPPVALPLRAQAQKHRLAPPKPKDPRAHP
ncbi:hypothetical protein GE061_013653 [Apolygus lucorum]|uniref:CCHC-type domain-containing protein n=2 Tax=Apolygus lucorum TaxID=248454 RepID=A0A8S9XNK1_APOLU|nr:hypothetical protein GE061_013653 [Apolygus lucorum]